MQLSEVVKVMVGDMVRLTDYVGDQFSLRPVMGYPPPPLDRSRKWSKGYKDKGEEG